MLLLFTVLRETLIFCLLAHVLTDDGLSCRKEKLAPPLDFTAFKSWLASRSTNEPQESNARIGTPPGPSESPSSGQPTSNAAAANPREPAYPTSFAHIVELITTGQPIPGIQQIPDTVLDGHDITSEKPRRRKPWERVEAAPDEDRATSDPA